MQTLKFQVIKNKKIPILIFYVQDNVWIGVWYNSDVYFVSIYIPTSCSYYISHMTVTYLLTLVNKYPSTVIQIF